jgi:hypothetical protein
VAIQRSQGLLVEAQPLGAAEEICRALVKGVRIANGALLLAADPAWAGAINTVLVKKGVRVTGLRSVDETLPPHCPRGFDAWRTTTQR